MIQGVVSRGDDRVTLVDNEWQSETLQLEATLLNSAGIGTQGTNNVLPTALDEVLEQARELIQGDSYVNLVPLQSFPGRVY